MRARLLLIVVALLRAVTSVHAQESSPPSGTILFGEKGRPEVVAWAVDDQSEPFVGRLNDDNFEVTVPAGEGCLVFLRSDYLPILEATEIEGGSERSVSELKWSAGPTFLGSAVDSGGVPVPAVVRFGETAAAKDGTKRLCREALAAAGFYEVQAASNGHFESPPVQPGRYALFFEAPDYATVERVLVVDGTKTGHDLGEITMRAVARVDVVLNATDIDADPPFDLVVESENETTTFQAERWENPIEAEIGTDLRVQVETEPGLHRLTLTKTGTDLKYSTEETFSPGWQETVLHPEPIFLEGTVRTDDFPVENAEVSVATADVRHTTRTDADGFYEMTLWVRAQFGAMATSPNGDRQIQSIDLTEVEPGELVEQDFDLDTGKISGRVVARSDQSPLEGCYVGIMLDSTDVGFGGGTRTSADGAFIFKGIWEADSVRLFAHMEGFRQREIEVEYAGEDISGVWIELDEIGSANGRVVGPAGNPLAGIEVLLCEPGLGGFCSVNTVTGQDGSFSVDAQPGDVVYAQAAGYSIGWAVVRDGEEAVIGLKGLSAATRVVVQDGNGEPAAGVLMTYVSDSGVALPFSLVQKHTLQNGLSRMTDAAGILDVASLPPGSYQVLMAGQSGIVNLGMLPIPSSGEVTLRVPDMKRTRDDEQKAEANSIPVDTALERPLCKARPRAGCQRFLGHNHTSETTSAAVAATEPRCQPQRLSLSQPLKLNRQRGTPSLWGAPDFPLALPERSHLEHCLPATLFGTAGSGCQTMFKMAPPPRATRISTPFPGGARHLRRTIEPIVSTRALPVGGGVGGKSEIRNPKSEISSAILRPNINWRRRAGELACSTRSFSSSISGRSTRS